ncbi:MAG: hypothetical protein Q8O61_13225, partial [Nocardioides sp.]|nr:hypothetical protein [Nocardioides sp.]
MPSPDDDPATSRTHKPLGNDQTSQGHAENETHERTLLAGRNHHAQEGFDAATDDAIAKFLEPFADTFAVLHDVALTELPASEVVPELDELDVEVLQDATAMVEAFVEGGTSRDVATEMLRGALSFSTQPAFVNAVVKAIPAHVPNAVTGRVAEGIARARAAIPVYAAQGRAFLARTGRTLPRNRDTFLIAAAVTGAAALIAWAIKEDKADRDKMLAALRQRQLDEVAAHQAQLLEDLNQDRLLFATERTEEATQALGYLTYLGLTRLSALQALVADNDDYTTYSPADRNVVAELVALAQITAVVIASTRRTNVAHNDHDTDAHTETLHAAQELLNRYATDQNPGSP